jgi:hypothetical protein
VHDFRQDQPRQPDMHLGFLFKVYYLLFIFHYLFIICRLGFSVRILGTEVLNFRLQPPDR